LFPFFVFFLHLSIFSVQYSIFLLWVISVLILSDSRAWN
jgi:hypothetical protein